MLSPTLAKRWTPGLHTLMAAMAGVAAVSGAPVEAPRVAPNMLLILVDDMGINGVSCYGQKPWQTPHIDRLAAAGMRFTNAYVHPVCSPTRASLLTGRHPVATGVTNWIPGWAERSVNPPLLEKPFQQFLQLDELTISQAPL